MRTCCGCKMFNCCTIRIKINEYIQEAAKLAKDLPKLQELYITQARNCKGYNKEND